MIRALPHILARVFNTPLLIAPLRAQALVSGLSAVMLQRGTSEPAMAFDKDDAPAGDDPPPRARGYRVDRGVALLPVRGVLVRRAGRIDADSTPLQSYDGIRSSLRAARADNRVRGILLELDTPGGEAGGIFDLANEIAAQSDKPVWAVANDDALSAGYAIAAAAQRLWITDTGAAGSIGVVALHLDQSVFDEEQGFRFTYIYRGAHKIDANPHEPLSPAASEAIQGEVDRLYGMLIANVAAHRAMAPERLQATEAAILFGANAVEAGLANQLGTLDQAHAAMAEHVAASPAPRRTAARSDRRTPMDPTEHTGDPTENVVSIDQMRAAVADTRSQAGEIAALCALAGYPEMAADEIKNNAPLDQVRQRLQARQAAAQSQRQVETIDTTARSAASSVGADLTAAANVRFAAQARGHA